MQISIKWHNFNFVELNSNEKWFIVMTAMNSWSPYLSKMNIFHRSTFNMFFILIVTILLPTVLADPNRETGQTTDLNQTQSSSSSALVNASDLSWSESCARQGHWGCHKGYCWSECHEHIGSDRFFNKWCYTTNTYEQSGEYVGCNSDEDCDRCWQCAGSCTI